MRANILREKLNAGKATVSTHIHTVWPSIVEALGHTVTWGQEGISHGIVQLIQMDPDTGVKAGASDPRGDGHAAAV